MAQLVFISGIDKTEDKASTCAQDCFNMIQIFKKILEHLFCNSCFIAVPVPCYLHVDANGGCGFVHNTSQGLCTQSKALHHRIHCH